MSSAASSSSGRAERPATVPGNSTSAEQPALPVESAEYMFKSSAARPASCNNWYRLSFYNIGWNLASKKARHTMEGLATEICNMVHDKCVDAVGISEVFNLKHDMWQQRQDIMQHVVSKLNSSAARPATSVDSSAARPAWTGRSDGHYIFVWNSSRLLLTDYEYVSCGIKEQTWRMAQYLQFKCAESQDDPPLHVCHNHSPSSNGQLTDGRRKRIFRSLWAHAMQNDYGSGSQPVAVFAGDFNCKPLQWIQCLQYVMEAWASRRSVQMCASKEMPLHHGDRAIVFNAFAAQENSGWGKSHIRANESKPFSDAHDVVLVPLCWSHLQSAGGAARPALPPGAMEPQIIKPGSPRNQESPPDSPQPIDAKTQLTIPWVSTEEETSSIAARLDSLELDRFGDFES